VSGTALSFIKSYLTDRKQFVNIGQHKSNETKLEVGVAQGSVEPLLFDVYCSPVADVMHGVQLNSDKSEPLIGETANQLWQHPLCRR